MDISPPRCNEGTCAREINVCSGLSSTHSDDIMTGINCMDGGPSSRRQRGKRRFDQIEGPGDGYSHSNDDSNKHRKMVQGKGKIIKVITTGLEWNGFSPSSCNE